MAPAYFFRAGAFAAALAGAAVLAGAAALAGLAGCGCRRVEGLGEAGALAERIEVGVLRRQVAVLVVERDRLLQVLRARAARRTAGVGDAQHVLDVVVVRVIGLELPQQREPVGERAAVDGDGGGVDPLLEGAGARAVAVPLSLADAEVDPRAFLEFLLVRVGADDLAQQFGRPAKLALLQRLEAVLEDLDRKRVRRRPCLDHGLLRHRGRRRRTACVPSWREEPACAARPSPAWPVSRLWRALPRPLPAGLAFTTGLAFTVGRTFFAAGFAADFVVAGRAGEVRRGFGMFNPKEGCAQRTARGCRRR